MRRKTDRPTCLPRGVIARDAEGRARRPELPTPTRRPRDTPLSGRSAERLAPRPFMSSCAARDAEMSRSDTTPRPHANVWRLLLVLTVVVVAALVARAGWIDQLTEIRRLTATIAASGPLGMALFLVAYTLLQPFGVPGTVFVVAAPLIWPWPVAFALSMTGTMGASVVGFSFARFVARDWVAQRLPQRWRRYDADLESHGLRTVFLLRMIFWMPQPLHALFGLSRVPFWTHVWGSLFGYVPPLLAVSYFGSQMFDADGRMQPMAWPVMGALLVVSGLVLLVDRWRTSPLRRAP